MFSHIAGRKPTARFVAPSLIVLLLAASAAAQDSPQPQFAASGGYGAEPAVHRIRSPNERMELTANSSRVITLDQNIPRAQVNNREILELTALSPTEIQVFAKKPGVTQVNLWNDKGQIYTIDCVVFGDARELSELIRSEFPNANIRVKPLASSVWLSGYVDRPDQVSQIISLAQDYYPTVKSNIEVVGVQQILLHVKIAEVSRTKARNLGFDFASINGNDFLVSSISGLISAASVPGVPTATGDTVRWGLVADDVSFFGFLEALRRYDVLKVLADPTLVTVSGRPAQFQVGGQFPVLVPQSLGTVSIEYKPFGTQLDFVPIVLGNGNIRLEVRPQVSEIDPTISVTLAGFTAPGLRTRIVDTGVEMRAGQTLAIAGLVQTRLEARNRGIPWLADLPYIGAGFRRVHEEVNEVELLILVTPELAQAVDKCDAPRCFPGMHTDSPSDCEMYWKGYIEVPSKGPCGPNGACGPDGCPIPQDGMNPGEAPNGGMPMRSYEQVPPGTPPAGSWPTTGGPPGGMGPQARGNNLRTASTAPIATSPPMNSAPQVKAPELGYSTMPGAGDASSSRRMPPGAVPSAAMSGTATAPAQGGVYPPNSTNRYNPPPGQDPRIGGGSQTDGGAPGFIGPVGYDVLN